MEKACSALMVTAIKNPKLCFQRQLYNYFQTKADRYDSDLNDFIIKIQQGDRPDQVLRECIRWPFTSQTKQSMMATFERESVNCRGFWRVLKLLSNEREDERNKLTYAAGNCRLLRRALYPVTVVARCEAEIQRQLQLLDMINEDVVYFADDLHQATLHRMHNDSLIDDDDDDGELYELSLYELVNLLVYSLRGDRPASRRRQLARHICHVDSTQEWFLPWSLCQIVPYAETVSLSVSVFTLTASAVHEFRTVFFAKNRRVNGRSVKSFVVMIWLIAAVVSLPHVYADESWWKIYNIYLTIIHYFVPMIILDTAYTMIAIKCLLTCTDLLKVVQLMNMLMIVVACFSLCWFPLETYLLLNEVRPEINGWKYINVLFFCSHWLAMSNSCLNPIIYGLYNDKYKREYKHVLKIIRCQPVPESTEEVLKFETEFTGKIISACDLPGAKGECARRWTTDVNS
uniref:G_PROTEIN_RECEP_F1_2 domain-containing protein n=1 Tax=Angiostrongylus cantonensis TaxID=6313 RepID=A0A158P6U5_ANGCA